MVKIRCAIYTRKSSEDGLDMDFNTLDAQREAGENYVLSQKHEGWIPLPEHYDDGGFSGGNTNRPAFKKLMQDVERGLWADIDGGGIVHNLQDIGVVFQKEIELNISGWKIFGVWEYGK